MAKTYPCSVCSENCETDCIFCETCNKWVHYSCQNINESDSKCWEKVPLGYICILCRCDENGQLDFLMGTERLKQAAKGGVKKLKTAVSRELLFVKNVPVHTTLHQDFSLHEQDPVSNFILSHYCVASKTALLSTGDGDCLFNSVSLLLVGNESMSIELRYRCCIEMVTNKSKIRLHRMYRHLELLSPDYDEDCLNCAQPGNWSSAWMILSLSNLLNLPIRSVFPAIDSSTSHRFKTLNYLFKPPFSDPEKGTLSILWTNTVPPERNGFVKRRRPAYTWGPNHFVPLVVQPRRVEYAPPSSSSTEGTMPVVNDIPMYQSPNRFEIIRQEDQDGMQQQ